jgi:hypothetical protein
VRKKTPGDKYFAKAASKVEPAEPSESERSPGRRPSCGEGSAELTWAEAEGEAEGEAERLRQGAEAT